MSLAVLVNSSAPAGSGELAIRATEVRFPLRLDFTEGVKNVVETRDFIGARLPPVAAERA